MIYVFTADPWFKPLKDKKGKAVLNAFIEIVNEFNWKPNKLWAAQENLMQEWLNNVDILMYSTQNEGKPVIAE